MYGSELTCIREPRRMDADSGGNLHRIFIYTCSCRMGIRDLSRLPTYLPAVSKMAIWDNPCHFVVPDHMIFSA